MEVRDENLPIGYNVHYLGNGYPKSSDLTTIQYTHVTKVHLYSLNTLKLKKKKKRKLS